MREWIIEGFDADSFRNQVGRIPRLRMPSPMYPGFVHGLLYDSDYDEKITRKDLQLPLDFNDPVHGVYSGYSDAGKTAVWMNMMVRPDHYLGAGHHHADAGMFHFSALGIDWFTESPFPQAYAGNIIIRSWLMEDQKQKMNQARALLIRLRQPIWAPPVEATEALPQRISPIHMLTGG